MPSSLVLYKIILQRLMPYVFQGLLIGMLVACGDHPAGRNNPASTPSEEKAPGTEPGTLDVALSKEQANNAGILLDSLRWLPLSKEIILSGQIEAPPQNLISVSIPMPGLLRSTHLLPGMQVAKGEILATMEDPAFIKMQEQYWSASILAEKLNAELILQQELLSTGASNPKTLRDLRSELRTVQVQAKSLGEQLRLLGLDLKQLNEQTMLRQVPVRSPVHGFVTKVHHSTGHYVAAGEALYELVDPSDVHLRLNAYEKDLPYLFEKQEVKAFNNQASQEEHAAHILLIGKEFAADRSVEVHCHFDRYDRNLIPGMYMRAKVLGKSQATACLPSAALQNFRGQHYAFEKVQASQTSHEFHFRGHKVKVLHENKGMTWFEFEDQAQIQHAGRTFAVAGTYSLLMLAFNKAEEE